MDFPGRFRRYRCPGLVVLLLAILSGYSGAQVFPPGPPVDTALVEFDPDRVPKGNRFTIQVRTTIPWGEEVFISRPELNGPMVWWAYPYARSWTSQNEQGESVRQIEVLASIRVDAPGFHTIGPFRITAGNRSVTTEAKSVIGLDSDEVDLPYPVFTEWRTPPLEIWQGESVPVVLEARNLASLTLADSVTLQSAPGGLLETAPGMGGIVTRLWENEVLYDVPMASWIWTLPEPGTYRFPSARIDISGKIRNTPGFPVEVKPVPEAALESGAVGRFRLDYEIEPGPYYAGGVVTLRVRVEGEGNMNVLRLPIPEFAGAELVGQGSASSYIPGPAGFEGWREERYDFQLERTGQLEYTIPGWIWFDPGDNAGVTRTRDSSGVIEVAAAVSEGEEQELSLLGADIFRYPESGFHWKHSYWYLLSLPGFIVFIILFLVKRPGPSLSAAVVFLPLLLSASNIDPALLELASRAAESGTAGEWLDARSVYLEIGQRRGVFPGLLHDLSIVEMELGNSDLAVAYMRQANRLRPGSPRLNASLLLLERHLGLDDQVPPPLRLPPALFFSFLIVSINLSFAALILLIYRRGTRSVFLALSVGLLLVTSVTATLVAGDLWSRETGVVTSNAAPLRKIPGPLASDWIQLPAGTAVIVVAREGDDILVRTGYGLEGWLPAIALIEIGGEIDGL